MKISIIIPVYNEEKFINYTLQNIISLPRNIEIIFVDGKSTDNTKEIITHKIKKFPNIKLIETNKGRANQMNFGAKNLTGDILVFLHADSILPSNFDLKIKKLINSKKIIGGAFSITFGKSSIPLRLINLYSNLRAKIWHIFHGDQGIFIKKSVFTKIGAYPFVPLMEDVLLSEKMRKYGKVILLKDNIQSSPRRILKTGIIKSIILYFTIKLLYKLGTKPKILAKIYTFTKQ